MWLELWVNVRIEWRSARAAGDFQEADILRREMRRYAVEYGYEVLGLSYSALDECRFSGGR